MSENNSRKKYKRPKENTTNTTNPRPSNSHKNEHGQKPLCPLLAKDSEWVDIQPPGQAQSASTAAPSDQEEEILQLIDCEDGPEMKPLAIMFPDLLEKDPQTLQGVLDKAMSTTEVTRRLVDLGQKANFSSMNKSSRLIPKDKQWLEKVSEDVNSVYSEESALSGTTSHEYEADHEIRPKKSRRRIRKNMPVPFIMNSCSSLNSTLNLEERENPGSTNDNN